MIKNLRIVSALLIVLGVAPITSAKKTTYDLSGRETSGFNALDHVLQKPLGNDTFPSDDRGFGRHLFIGAGGGISARANSLSRNLNPGGHGGVQLGSWFTPIHGIRVGFDAGSLSVLDGAPSTSFQAYRAEYLINLTSLLRGYAPFRRFEMIGSMGIQAERIHQDSWLFNAGLVSSLQLRFNVAPSLFLFVEPRIAVMGGKCYDFTNLDNRLKFDASLNAGIGYRILTGEMRKMWSRPLIQRDDDNLYFGAGGGLWTPTNDFTGKNAYARAFVGKMFSSTSGLQLNVGIGHQPNDHAISRDRFFGIGSLDYILNLNSLTGGYRPGQTFQILLNAGVAGGMVLRTGTDGRDGNRAFAPGLSVGLTGLLRLTENWGIYVHPQLFAFTDKFSEGLAYKTTPYAMIDFGVRYTIGRFSRLFPESFSQYDETNHWFITSGAGIGLRTRASDLFGYQGYFGIGKRFSPISSWRVTVEGDNFTKFPRALGLTLNVDYMSSITTAMYGFKADRLFDLQGVIGLLGGFGNVNAENRGHYTMGLRAGLQFGFRLNNAVDLYFEPQCLFAYMPVTLTKHNEWTPIVRANVGVRYKLGAPADGERGTLAETPYGDHRNFVSLAGGPTSFSQATANGRSGARVTGAVNLAVGRWFSMVSGARLSVGNSFLYLNSADPEQAGNKSVGSAHLDYLLNISSLFDRSASRKLHVIGAVGAGAAMGFGDDTKVGFMGYGGAQLRYNLPANIDVHVEPGAEFWSNSVMPEEFQSPSDFILSPRLTFGVSYRF